MKKRFKATKPANGLMPRLLMLTFTAGLLITAGPALAAGGGGSFVPGTCAPDEVQGSGAIYRICMPSAELYNGDLVVWQFRPPPDGPQLLCASRQYIRFYRERHRNRFRPGPLPSVIVLEREA